MFRADGNARIGLGHLTRCRVLAELLATQGHTCLLATREPLGPNWFGLGREAGRSLGHHDWVRVLPIPADVALADEPAWLGQQLTAYDLLVLDGYDFDLAYQLRWGQLGRGLVLFDDFARAYSPADVVLNAAGGLTAAHYAGRTAPGAQLALGPAYALLRPEFWQAQRRATKPPNTDRVFLNLGGADPHNHTLPLMRELAARFPTRHLSVVTGAAYAHRPALEAAARALPQVRLHHDLSARALAELLRRCGLYVCPPSGMASECAAVGGLLLVFLTAGNQQLVYNYLTQNQLALPYSALADLPVAELPALAAAMRARQRQVFSPDGIAARYGRVFEDLGRTYQLDVRRATAADATLYFSWANDPSVRATATRPEPIAWADHLAWFERRLADPHCYLLLFGLRGQLLGQVRVEFREEMGTISYSLDAAWRGQGLGTAVLRRALAELRRARPGRWTLDGLVRTSNAASARIFERLGFDAAGTETHGEADFTRFRQEVPAVPTFA